MSANFEDAPKSADKFQIEKNDSFKDNVEDEEIA